PPDEVDKRITGKKKSVSSNPEKQKMKNTIPKTKKYKKKTSGAWFKTRKIENKKYDKIPTQNWQTKKKSKTTIKEK
ncbi:24963_t:CDS:1, partial [Gigaspora margarita]